MGFVELIEPSVCVVLVAQLSVNEVLEIGTVVEPDAHWLWNVLNEFDD